MGSEYVFLFEEYRDRLERVEFEEGIKKNVRITGILTYSAG
jgi:hypothetical protein